MDFEPPVWFLFVMSGIRQLLKKEPNGVAKEYLGEDRKRSATYVLYDDAHQIQLFSSDLEATISKHIQFLTVSIFQDNLLSRPMIRWQYTDGYQYRKVLSYPEFCLSS